VPAKLFAARRIRVDRVLHVEGKAHVSLHTDGPREDWRPDGFFKKLGSALLDGLTNPRGRNRPSDDSIDASVICPTIVLCRACPGTCSVNDLQSLYPGPTVFARPPIA